MIDKTAKIASGVVISEGVSIGKNVVIEEDSFLDIGCIVRDNVHIGKNSFVGANCIIGEYLSDFFQDRQNKIHPLTIGDNALIRSGTIIYGDTFIGNNFQTGHRVSIREGAKIGDNVRIGTLSDIQGFCVIENYVNIHSNVHIGQNSIIHSFVWLFPYVVLTNDPLPPSNVTCGVEIDSYAVVATKTVILPGVHIEEDALIGAGSVVTHNVDKNTVVFGNPAKKQGLVTDILDKEGNFAYPWRDHFDRGMPWEGVGYEKWKAGLK